MNQEQTELLIRELLQINAALDTYRSNINILCYNLSKNKKELKVIPKFNYDLTKKLVDNLGMVLSGTIKDYNEQVHPSIIAAEKKQEEKKDKKNG